MGESSLSLIGQIDGMFNFYGQACSRRSRTRLIYMGESSLKASFRSRGLSVGWGGQENFSLSCELWVGTNNFKAGPILRKFQYCTL
jgi:hypothetical protein